MTDIDDKRTRLNAQYREDGWGRVAEAAGLEPYNTESQARAVARYAAARIAELEGRSVWRPIESALKNGSEELVWRQDGGWFVAVWRSELDWWERDPNFPLEEHECSTEPEWWSPEGDYLGDDLSPTHVFRMDLLPPPPTEDGGAAT